MSRNPQQTCHLWYQQPASAWMEALPLGNGRLGAMLFGGMERERVALNELTLSAGGPHNYDNSEALAALPELRRLVFAGQFAEAQALADDKFMGQPITQMPYQTVGDLHLYFPESVVTDYRRELDLRTAVAGVTYVSEGVEFVREAFVSAVDEVFVLRLTANQPGKITFTAAFDSPQQVTVETQGAETLTLHGIAGEAMGIAGVTKFTALAKVVREGGTIDTESDQLTVTRADAVTLFISLATGYKNYADVSADADALACKYLEAAAGKPYSVLYDAHLAGYQRLFQRVSLDLGTSPLSDEPTDVRLRAFQLEPDPSLAALNFQYGRYLLIASSRPGGQPANLQGLWNDSLSPPWGSKYTININTEMNYWLAETCALPECAEPLFQLIAEIAETGQRTAQAQYGASGWVCHHNTDAWRATAPTDGAHWGMWMTGGAWLCTHLWEHYLFTQDKDALLRHYPLLKGAAEFFLDTLVPEPTHGWLVTCPAISPENAHHPDVSICAGPTMDEQILRDLFGACAEASDVLGLDPDFREQVILARSRLAPTQIGAQGHIQEWLEDWDADAPEQGHRHVSHLYGLHPSHQITRRGTPSLFDAARVSLERRGDAGTGWSLAWKINLWARLEDGDRAYKLICDALTLVDSESAKSGGVYPNLLDAHPPFQIDGNFGFTAGIAEMLLQSHAGEIHLLPALPIAWNEGSVHGLVGRGNMTVDIDWSQGALTSATLTPRYTGPFTIRYNGKTLSVNAIANEAIALAADHFIA